jgi:hypothetical protein
MSLPGTPGRTTPGFSFSIVERSLRDCIAERRFGKSEAQTASDFFDGACAFCGGPIERWDHLVPVSVGGDTVLGNMVPACAKCDDSKQGLEFESWTRGSAPSPPASRGVEDVEGRVSRIREYVSAYGYQARGPHDRLTPDELRQYEIIRTDLKRARDDIDEFLRMYRERTGLK